MWFDCNNVLINLDHLDYISFEEAEDCWKAIVFFASGDSLTFEHHDIEVLKDHFKKVLENEQNRQMGS
jgi:hypothetical protein